MPKEIRERPLSPSRKHEVYELPGTMTKRLFICREQDLPLAPAPRITGATSTVLSWGRLTIGRCTGEGRY
jgi:hypothetical protein